MHHHYDYARMIDAAEAIIVSVARCGNLQQRFAAASIACCA
jgi:hypothetical protein